jgi:transcriptional regulator with XRE-family HTH domain
MNCEDLAEFLRSRRARLRPAEAGLPEGPRRRTPGLRRQEVAQPAGMSVEYYIRLEQARGPRPSRQILNALGRALMLTMDERAHLFRSGVADLSAAAGRYPDDTSISELVDDLLRTSPEFGELWADREVRVRRTICKHFDHPRVGPIEIDCQVLLIPDRDQRLVLYATEPGSPSYLTMQLLRWSMLDKEAGRMGEHPDPAAPLPDQRGS